MAETSKNLGDVLVQEGVLSREEFDDVLEKSKARNLSLEETLFKLGYISRDKLGGLLAGLHDCEFIDLYSRKVDSDAIRMIPPEQALELKALPYAFEGGQLLVAIAGDSLETMSLNEIVSHLERLSGKKVSISLCNPGPLNEMLMRFCRGEPKSDSSAFASRGELASIFRSMKSDQVEGTLRAQIEELHDIGQTALIGARSHPFSRAITSSIEEAKEKLSESKKYIESGFEGEAIEMARQAVTLVKDATARADGFEKDWEKLLQEVKLLRGRIASLESEGAGEYAEPEFKELVELREGLLECVNERNVDKLRSLLDQGMVVTEKLSLLEPGRTRGREQVISSLAQVRQVITRARNAGAKENAPDMLKDAYEYLDRAEAYARHAHWEDVRECLSAAESKALEAERISINAEKEKKHLTVKLRESIRIAMGLFEDAITHACAHEVIENLMRAKDVIKETKACFDSDELERGIGLAQNIAKRIREEIIPLADEADRLWRDLFARADAASALIQNIDIPLALKIAPEKMRRLFQSEREMVSSLCERDRDKLEEAVTICEGLAEEVRQQTAGVQDRLREAESVLEDVGELLASTSAAGIDEQVASTYQEARRMLEQAHSFFERGDAEASIIRAQTAQAKLESEVIEPQDSARREWRDLSLRASEASKQIHTMNIPLGLSVVPRKMEMLFESEREMVSALSAGDSEKLAEAVSTCEGLGEEIRTRLTTAQDRLKHVENIIKEVDALLASASASGIDEVIAPAYEEARRMLEEARSFFEGGDADAAHSHAQAARVKIETDVIEPRDSAQREWNELSQKAIEVSEQIQAMNMPVVLRVSPEKMEMLFQKERDMIGALSERDRDMLVESLSACERLVEEIRHEVSGAREILRQAETEIEEAVRFLATAAASGIDEMVAQAYDDSRRMLEEAKILFDHGESEAALERSQAARAKLETEVIELQDSLRQAWLEASHSADKAFEKIRSIDLALAFKVAKEEMAALFEAERDMARALCETNRERLTEAVARCDVLVEEINHDIDTSRDILRQAETEIEEAIKLLAMAAASGIDEKVAPAYGESRRMLQEARVLFDQGDTRAAIECAQAALAKLDSDVIDRQNQIREKWNGLSPMALELLGRADHACSANAMRYCPELIHSLRVKTAELASAVAARDLEQLEPCMTEALEAVQSVESAVEQAKADRHRDLFGRLTETENALEQAVERCAGNYSSDMLEEAYSHLNMIREHLSKGPENIFSELDNQLMRDLAIAQTKVWQVEAMRERIEREREENLARARHELASAREAVDGCTGRHFVDESSTFMRTAREYVNQADGLIVEGEIEASFERLRQAKVLADRIGIEAEQKEARWQELAGQLTADDAPHKAALSDPAAGKATEEERTRLAGLHEHTRSIIDSRDLDALEAHAKNLGELANTIADRVEAWKSQRRARVEEKLSSAGQEIRLAELMGATKSCPDIYNAAVTYVDIAKGYLASEDFDNAEPAASDALAKSREAGSLAKASSQRESVLALDYMKIAAAHIAQQNIEGAKLALDKGLNLIRSAGVEEPSREPGDSQDQPEPGN
jgi:hypothetical protein